MVSVYFKRNRFYEFINI